VLAQGSAANGRQAADQNTKTGTDDAPKTVMVTTSKFETLGRLGLFTKATLYAVIGILSLRAAFSGGRGSGSQEALMHIASQPFGSFLLILMAIGLFSYALFRFVQAGLDLDRDGTDEKGLAKRIGQGASGALHLALGIWAVSILVGSRSAGGGKEGWTAELLQNTWGQWLVGIVGVGVLFAAVAHFVTAYRHTFMNELKREQMSPKEERVARRVGEVGLIARGVVLVLIGWFLIDAAVTRDPGEAGGLGKALATMAAQPWGPWLLAAISIGLLAYAVYCGFQGRYRRIPQPV
jgi:succinate dehydrogenase/fumarate reductase cytochrome b subunit